MAELSKEYKSLHNVIRVKNEELKKIRALSRIILSERCEVLLIVTLG